MMMIYYMMWICCFFHDWEYKIFFLLSSFVTLDFSGLLFFVVVIVFRLFTFVARIALILETRSIAFCFVLTRNLLAHYYRKVVVNKVTSPLDAADAL